MMTMVIHLDAREGFVDLFIFVILIIFIPTGKLAEFE